MSNDDLRREVDASIRMRAMAYWHIFQAMIPEVGEDKAIDIMKRGIRALGEELGPRMKLPEEHEAHWDFISEGAAHGGNQFEPEMIRCDAECLEFKNQRCPLKAVWLQELGEEKTELMTEIASSIDHGMLGTTGLDFEVNTWKRGQEGCCHFVLRPSKS